jgi:hypothetical protein
MIAGTLTTVETKVRSLGESGILATRIACLDIR